MFDQSDQFGQIYHQHQPLSCPDIHQRSSFRFEQALNIENNVKIISKLLASETSCTFVLQLLLVLKMIVITIFIVWF